MNHVNEGQPGPPADPPRPLRIRGFARYFRGYMGVSAIVVAALPIPAEAFRLVPAYTAQRGLLAVCTSLFAFLVLAFLFYSRHRIAGSMFCPGAGGCYAAKPAAAWLPLVLILGSLAMVFCYQAELDASISLRRQTTQLIGITKADDILAGTAVPDIPRAIPLMVLYLSIFICAEAAFVWMALREYLQDVLGITEQELLHPGHPDSRVPTLPHSASPNF